MDIVIIGAGFAGLSALLGLIKSGLKINLTIIDPKKEFEYIPSLHLCLNKDQYCDGLKIPLYKHFRKYYRNDEVISVSKDTVTGRKNSYHYDHLIVASGNVTRVFNDSFDKYSFPVKSIDDVRKINEKLSNAKDISIIGGGFTGVEVASILSDTGKNITLITAGPRVLDNMSRTTSSMVGKYLRSRGINIMINSMVDRCRNDSVLLGTGKEIKSDLTINVAGIQANDNFIRSLTDVDDDFRMVKNKNIFFCGDCAKTGTMSTAHNAMIEGRQVAKILSKKIMGKKVKDQVHKDWKILAIALGRYDGLISFGTFPIRLPITGFLKWIREKRVMLEFKHHIRLPI